MGTVASPKPTGDSWAYSQPANVSYTSKSYSTSSTSPRSGGKVALDEQTQLDQILSDLLNDQAFVSQKSPSSRSGMSTETRSFKTVEDHISPEGNVVVQRSDVTYKVPEVRKEEKHYTVKTETKTVKQDQSYKPVNAFTYTPPSPEMARSFEPIRSPGSPKPGSLPYRTDYENNYKKESYSYQTNGPSSLSDGEQSLSWLQQQQAKLREKSSERDPRRDQNERMMLEELKTAQSQNKYFARRAQSEDEATSRTTSSQLSNGPTSPYSYTVSRTHTYEKSPDSTFRPHDTLPISHSHTTYITEQQQNVSTSSKVSNKPPPSPNLQRTVTPTLSAPPVPPPQRTSSKDYMQHQHQHQSRARTNSGNSYQVQSSSSWRSETHSQPRVVHRTQSESAYEREPLEKQHVPRSHITPPASPRSVSPQTYQTYKTVYKTIHHRGDDEPDFVEPVEAKMERQVQQTAQTQQTVQETNKPHYITEVIVQRTGGADSKSSTLNRSGELESKDSDNRLEALEKSLQAASHSIMATAPWQQQQQQQQMQKSEEIRRYETRTYETKSEHREERQQQQQQTVQQTHTEPPPPPPKKIEVTEEDRITLKPIGPGVQQLEPEGSHTGTLGRDSTLGRATTPSFPTSPVISAATPPFPVTPKTPYQNLTGGSHVISPTGTLQSTEKMQYQTEYRQNQQYQTQTLPHGSQAVSQSFQTSTLPHQSSLQQSQPLQPPLVQPVQLQQQQQQQPQQQQVFQQQQQRQFVQQQSSSSQQYHTQQYSSSASHDGTLHVDTNQPKVLMQSRSPSSPGSPPSPSNLNTLRQQLNFAHSMSNSAVSPGPHSATGQSSPSVYFGLSRRGSLTSLADSEAVHTTPRFVKDTSKFWYKPSISREEAIMMLKDKAPGTFVVRDSNSFPGAFGLALKVATLPPNVQSKSTGDPAADLVRHFLIEPTSKGVRLRGCSNEPVFGSLASLVYQHSITPLALPCKLVLPEQDPAHIVTEVSPTTEMPSSASALLAQGAACNVVFLNTVDTESLTGPQAVARACKVTIENPPPKTTIVHFKVSNQGITLTDNQRKLFFRRHYPVAAVTYCGMDPEDRKWRRDTDVPGVQAEVKVFGFVARKQGSISDNACHLFAELDPDQPANAIVNFVTKVMIGQGKIKS